MKEKLLKLLTHSYVPLSHFAVACIITTKDNQEWVGVNVENASFKDGLCAEQNALAQVLTYGYQSADILKLAIMAQSDKIIKPCFLCRQLLSEYLPADCSIVCYNQQGSYREYKVHELCPLPFGKADINEVNNEN